MATHLLASAATPAVDIWPNGTAERRPRAMNPRRIATGNLGDEELEELRGQTRLLTYEPGRLLYAPGEPGEALYVLVEGRVQLYRLSPGGRKLVLARLQAGAFFGAIAPLGHETYQSYAETVERCGLYRLSRADTERLLREKPQLALCLIARLAERVRYLEGQLEAMAFQNVAARLASLLLRLATERDDNVVRGYSHQDLAEVLGTYRETVSDALNQFRAGGLVCTGRRRIVLEDRERLREVSQA
jgi:CRP-like cAMP-binding protein